MSKITVAVLFGGVSSEHEVSKMSAFCAIHALDPKKYNIVPIYITKTGSWLLYDGPVDNINHADLEKSDAHAFICPDTGMGPVVRILGEKHRNIPVDIVFPVLHGKNGEDGSVQGLCELTRLPYVGCGVLASSLCMDKAMTKLVAASIGLKQAKHIVFLRNEAENFAELYRTVKRKIGFPCFIKPANTGSSIGISKAADKAELEQAVKLALEHDRKIIIEKAVIGREFECSVLGNAEPVVSGVGEIVAPDGFYSYEAKYFDKGAKTLVRPEVDQNAEEEMKRQAAAIFKAVDGLGMARVDFFLEAGTGNVIFNEINTIPGFTNISMYSMMWDAAGIKQPELCDRLIELGLERYSL